jgi:hypothetical protein
MDNPKGFHPDVNKLHAQAWPTYATPDRTGLLTHTHRHSGASKHKRHTTKMRWSNVRKTDEYI